MNTVGSSHRINTKIHGVAETNTPSKHASTATPVQFMVQRCIMKKYVRKPAVVEAVQFTTNNEADNQQMNEIVEWIKSGGCAARHDGTCIYIENRSRRESRVAVGDWIIKHTQKFDCVFYSVPHYTFEEAFEPCEHLWEAVDDSKYDQCLVCGDTRLFELQYFGDEVL